ALKYQSESWSLQETKQGYQKALNLLKLIINNDDLLSSLSDPDEVYYLKSLVEAHLEEDGSRIVKSIDETITRFPNGKYAADSLLLMGTILFKMKEYAKAEEIFLKLEKTYPSSQLAGDGIFWAARSADEQQNWEKGKLYRQKMMEQYG